MQNAERRLVRVDPVVLSRQDLVELMQLMTTGLEPKTFSESMRIVGDDDEMLFIESAPQLLTEDLPRRVRQVSVQLRQHDGAGHIATSLTVNLSEASAQYQMQGGAPQWAQQTSAHLDRFFRGRRAWYAWVVLRGRWLPLAVTMTLLALSGLMLVLRLYIVAVIPAGLVFLLMELAERHSPLVPYVRIVRRA